MPPKEPPKKWKAPKGPKPVQRKQKNTIGLGKAILYQRARENRVDILPDGESRFQVEKKDADWVKLRSVTQESHIDDFLNSAELANKDFTAVKRNQITILGIKEDHDPTKLMSKEKEKAMNIEQLKNQNKLRVPRRPQWDKSMNKYVLDKQEKEAFLEWRRELSVLQNNQDLLLTPFERNLEVWRQLWRVIERSDLIVQIVDARNPLLFRSVDLETYVKEQDERKKNLLLVNKADLLSESQRRSWAEYFIKNGIAFAFFSAGLANEKLQEEKEREEEALENGVPLEEEKEEVAEPEPETVSDELSGDLEKDVEHKIKILTIDQLEQLFIKESPEPLTKPLNGSKPKLQIGLVGYPNVGKSSTINALVGAKKVSVSSTPGKTKHFQTIMLSDEVILCDCPGLVFPNFAYTNADLVCNGVLPIDQLRDSTGPTQVVCQKIPKFFLEAVYGIKIPIKSLEDGGTGIPTAQELLTAYARARGYMTQGFGSADQSRAARYILKDFVNGKLLFVQPPPKEDGTSKDIDECLKFNEDLYTLDLLSENRKNQIVQAIASHEDLDLATFNLSKDLEKLSFSSHVGADGVTHGGKQAELYSASAALNKEFFEMDRVKGVENVPFHRKGLVSGSKKHKKKPKKKTRTETKA